MWLVRGWQRDIFDIGIPLPFHTIDFLFIYFISFSYRFMISENRLKIEDVSCGWSEGGKEEFFILDFGIPLPFHTIDSLFIYFISFSYRFMISKNRLKIEGVSFGWSEGSKEAIFILDFDIPFSFHTTYSLFIYFISFSCHS